jgi:hypothetical protein
VTPQRLRRARIAAELAAHGYERKMIGWLLPAYEAAEVAVKLPVDAPGVAESTVKGLLRLARQRGFDTSSDSGAKQTAAIAHDRLRDHSAKLYESYCTLAAARRNPDEDPVYLRASAENLRLEAAAHVTWPVVEAHQIEADVAGYKVMRWTRTPTAGDSAGRITTGLAVGSSSSWLDGYDHGHGPYLVRFEEWATARAKQLEWRAGELEMDSPRLRELARKLKTTNDVKAFLAPDYKGRFLEAFLAATSLEKRHAAKAAWKSTGPKAVSVHAVLTEMMESDEETSGKRRLGPPWCQAGYAGAVPASPALGVEQEITDIETCRGDPTFPASTREPDPAASGPWEHVPETCWLPADDAAARVERERLRQCGKDASRIPR